MPEISRFLGIGVFMFFADHTPPHFHAVYGEHRVTVEILTGHITGRLPRRALRLVLEWRQLRQMELLADWERARRGVPLLWIAPLE